MGALTRRELLRATTAGAMAAGVTACSQPSQPARPAATSANATPPSTAPGPAPPPPPPGGPGFMVKLCVEGLSVLHREMAGSDITFMRLAAVNATNNSSLGLQPHAAILRIPRGILKHWTVPALTAGHDHVEWRIDGWKAQLGVTTVDGKTYTIGGETSVKANDAPVTKNSCGNVSANWVNARMMTQGSELTAEKPIANWHLAGVTAGYLEVPYGVIEDKSLTPEGRFEEFDKKIWFHGTSAAPKTGDRRAIKNVARILMQNVKSAIVTVNDKTITLERNPDYEYLWDKMPMRFSNFDPMPHSDGREFIAYYDLFTNPAAPADRTYPTALAEECGTTIECGCCPPIGI